jgi:hypothetical protein
MVSMGKTVPDFAGIGTARAVRLCERLTPLPVAPRIS